MLTHTAHTTIITIVPFIPIPLFVTVTVTSTSTSTVFMVTLFVFVVIVVGGVVGSVVFCVWLGWVTREQGKGKTRERQGKNKGRTRERQDKNKGGGQTRVG